MWWLEVEMIGLVIWGVCDRDLNGYGKDEKYMERKFEKIFIYRGYKENENLRKMIYFLRRDIKL